MTAADESARVIDARARAQDRLRRQRDTFRPLGLAIVVAVIAESIATHPAPGMHGRGLGVTLALIVFCAGLLSAIRHAFTGLPASVQVAVIAATASAGVALAVLQAKGATGVAGSAVVWMAVVRFRGPLGLTLGALTTAGLALAAALSGSSAAGVFATVLLCALLGLVAYFIRQARDGQERTEVLMAQLEDARDEQTRAAAIAERGRIASELHDVLAHSLSGAAIQLQGARKLGERHGIEPQVQAAIDRASELVRDGLTHARTAVGALRGNALPTVSELQALIESFREDMHVDVTLSVDGQSRPLPPEASLALYRGAQEALTNVARYAPGANARVSLRYESQRTTLTIDNSEPTEVGGLSGVGGGRGIEGLRERIERAGGTMEAGPLDRGWRVRLEVPA